MKKPKAMETKKDPSKDIHKMRGLFFLIGLAVSLSIVIAAFQWRTENIVVGPKAHDEWEHEIALLDPPITEIENKEANKTQAEPTKSSPAAAEFVEASTDDITISISDLFPSETDPVGTVSTIAVDPEPEEAPFLLLAEVQPEPKGGYSTFYQAVAKKIKYPRAAEQNGVEGKVYVSFIVEKDGTLSQLKLVTGIGYGCDEEALKSIPSIAWNPGKQRGKPVRVKMILPITFAIR